jgi:hypothetical protein
VLLLSNMVRAISSSSNLFATEKVSFFLQLFLVVISQPFSDAVVNNSDLCSMRLWSLYCFKHVSKCYLYSIEIYLNNYITHDNEKKKQIWCKLVSSTYIDVRKNMGKFPKNWYTIATILWYSSVKQNNIICYVQNFAITVTSKQLNDTWFLKNGINVKGRYNIP